jgi:hypothetical protein
MDWQQIISLGIVALSSVLLVRSEIQKRKRAKLTGCGHDCGCGESAPVDEEIFTIATKQRYQQ